VTRGLIRGIAGCAPQAVRDLGPGVVHGGNWGAVVHRDRGMGADADEQNLQVLGVRTQCPGRRRPGGPCSASTSRPSMTGPAAKANECVWPVGGPGEMKRSCGLPGAVAVKILMR